MSSNYKNKGVIILKVFIAGPRAIRELDEQIKQKLENVCNNNYEILVGDIECY